ncbi:MAG: tetratricopeptide repeat protein [Phycisphaeraceae bacterium]|nr:tetratricopeptide repeat protein [Phycisphaeraceae bacterium]
MALNFFKRGGKGEGPGSGDGGGSDAGAGDGKFERNPAKARRFFEHAQTVADARNYEYAISLYVDGLRHEPDNMAKHEALREVAEKYKVGGGKPAGLGERMKSTGKDPVSKFLDAERVWSKDPLNLSLMLEVMEKAVAALKAEPDLHMEEFVFWIGEMVIKFGRGNRKTTEKVFIQARDLFAEAGIYEKAVEACKYALALRPDDAKLLDELKNLEAEATLTTGAYGDAGGQEGGYRRMVRDAEKQRALEQQDALVRTGSVQEELIDRLRREYGEKPEEPDRLDKLVNALIQTNEEADEGEAVKLLREAFERTGQYRYKVRSGDVIIRQSNRKLRALRDKLKANPSDAEATAKYKELTAQLLKFELGEYTERVKNYPTDLSLRYQLGRRLMAFGKFDDAIAAFQEARADAKNRVQSLLYLGVCYSTKGWHQEAVDTLREAISGYPIEDDKIGLELRYHLMDALEKSARVDKSIELAKEAQKIASKILQTDIRFRDIKDRIDGLRSLVDELSKAG